VSISPDIQYYSVTLDQISPNPYQIHHQNLFLIVLSLWQNCYYFVTNVL